MKRLLVATMVFALCLPVMVFAQEDYTGPCSGNLIVNGDFEAGNDGFISDYLFVSATGHNTLGEPKTYAVGLNPYDYHSDWASFGDHTTGFGKMMIVNATCLIGGGGGCTETDALDDRVWEQTVDVEPGRDYVFKYWVALSFINPPPLLQVSVNGTPIGSGSPSGSVGTWQEVSYVWNSGEATSAKITIADQRPSYGGDDYALDDIQLCPAPPCAQTALLAGQNTPVGNVFVYESDGMLHVTFNVKAPWCFTELHLAVADDPLRIPQKNGNPIPGKFPFKYIPAKGACENTHTFDIPRSLYCPNIYIAAHAAVKDTTGYPCIDPITGQPTGKTGFRTETAWGEGPGFTGANWAMYFKASDCCTTP